jgi:hypothetical protein
MPQTDEEYLGLRGLSPSHPAENQQVLVLRDGGVLVGNIRHEGDRYLVQRDTLQMQVRDANVLLIAASLEDAYQQRRKSLGQGSTIAHLQLAEWCLRNDLINQAEAELKMAAKLEPHNELVNLLKRRLVLARQREVRADSIPPTKNQSSAKAELRSETTSVGELPDGAVELFTRRVQPVLVNNCTMAGCHEAGGQQKFQLDRALLHGLANRRSTTRNLAATLELVDREQPQLSPLITVPRQTHGGLDRPIFGPRHEAALRHLVDWVVLVARPSQPSPYESNVPATRDDVADVSASTESSEPLTLNTSEEVQEPQADAEPAEFEFAESHQQTIQYGAQLKRWTPRDEFDPEIFNRKYSPESSSQSSMDDMSTAAAEESTSD